MSHPAARLPKADVAPLVAICVATYRRPVMLGALMESLGRLVLGATPPRIIVVIVNNDADDAGDFAQVEGRLPLPWKVITDTEPTRNIALARNRCVELALAEGADWIAFVDDDEQVSPRWLQELMRVQKECRADVVGGAVVNSYPQGAPRWVVESELPKRQRRPTGPASPVADTCNVLIARRVFSMVPDCFDQRFGRSGGSDYHFFLRARLAGARIVWADDAVVFETIPASRSSVRWLVRRAFRTGNAEVLVSRSVFPVWRWMPRRTASAGYRMLRGTARLLPALVRGRAATVRALQDICLGAGAIAALAGYRYVEYTVSHGE